METRPYYGQVKRRPLLERHEWLLTLQSRSLRGWRHRRPATGAPKLLALGQYLPGYRCDGRMQSVPSRPAPLSQRLHRARAAPMEIRMTRVKTTEDMGF